jgi:hypothetical protein
MKKAVLIAFLMAGFWSAVAVAAPPAILFSDLTSGPNAGGQNNKGVFVTVVGRHFGTSRGTGSVTVGGGAADNYPVWTDTRITFQLGPNARTGAIVVTSPEGASNGLAFTVRPGRIFFVDDTSPNSPGSGTYEDPWRSPRSFLTAEQPGDTCYFRGGTYSGQYGSASRPYNVSFYNTGTPSGAPDNEIAWVGYPGEQALFKANDATVYNGAFELTSNVQYHVIAGLSIYGKGDGREQVRLYADNNKLVNCSIEGIKTLSYAMIGVTASNLKIWGNECFGATSANKLDHIIYFQSGGQSNNVDIGWNYIHDNDIAVGPVFSWNLGAGTVSNIRIHDNKIDCRNSSDVLRLAGIWSGSAGDISFINNLIIGAGGSLNNDNSYNAIYVGFGTAYIYHNTFYLSRGAGSSHVINTYGSGTADVRNNIFYNQSTCEYVNGPMTLDSNCYFGGAGGVPSGDAHPVTANPQFVNAAALDLHLLAASSVIGKGVNLTAAAPVDYDGVARRAGAIDLGAFQYGAAAAQPPAAATTIAISGTVRDKNGHGVSGVTVTLAGGAGAVTATGADGTYRFPGLAPGASYTVAAARAHWRLTPAAVTVAAPSTDSGGHDFTALPLYAIGGIIRDLKGKGIGGVAVSLSGAASTGTVTAADGTYRFDDLPAYGVYTLTPALAHWIFAPTSFVVNELVADFAAAGFTGRRTYAIKGSVTDVHGKPIAGTEVDLTGGGLALSRKTDANGYYEFPEVPENSDYRVTSAKSGYYFSPAVRNTGPLTSYIDGWNFEGAFVNSMLALGEVKVVGSAPGRGTVNPDRGETPKVYFRGTARGRFECRIFTVTGEQVWQATQDGVQEGTFDWPAAGIASGIYTAHIKGPGIDASRKIAILR